MSVLRQLHVERSMGSSLKKGPSIGRIRPKLYDTPADLRGGRFRLHDLLVKKINRHAFSRL